VLSSSLVEVARATCTAMKDSEGQQECEMKQDCKAVPALNSMYS
jgi:hypothetical protein